MGYINGRLREQAVLFPETLDDYVDGNNAVRAVEAFIEYLKFDELGFVRAQAAETGRPGYDPRVLLGILIWGNLNGIRSSRRLERECGRNIELMWLCGQLRPDFKTLCRFRQENGEAIGGVLVHFRMWAAGEGLFGKDLVAIDGSKFKAVNNARRSFTQGKLERLIARESRSVARYLEELEEADKNEGEEREEGLTADELKQKIATIGDYLQHHQELLHEMKESGENQKSLTDPEARLMKTAKGIDACYNVQTAVDSKHKLIVALEVTNEAVDQMQLAKMAQQAKEGLEVEKLTVVADGGYFGLEELRECEENGITAYVPVPELGDAKRRGLFTREEFKYDESRDVYTCPRGAELRVMSRNKKQGRNKKEFRVYATNECDGCPLRSQCTQSKHGRRIKRWVHQKVLERHQARMRAHPEMMQRRK